MRYIVEILVSSHDLANNMARMRTWLDHKGHVPRAYRSSAHLPDRAAVQIEFAVAAEADAFAQAFGGRVVVPQ